MAKNRNTFNKRKREVEKRQQAEDKRARKQQKRTEEPAGPQYVRMVDTEVVRIP